VLVTRYHPVMVGPRQRPQNAVFRFSLSAHRRQTIARSAARVSQRVFLLARYYEAQIQTRISDSLWLTRDLTRLSLSSRDIVRFRHRGFVAFTCLSAAIDLSSHKSAQKKGRNTLTRALTETSQLAPKGPHAPPRARGPGGSRPGETGTLRRKKGLSL
jgi:hypothetical protein